MLYPLFKQLRGSRVLICQLGQEGGRLFGEGGNMSMVSFFNEMGYKKKEV